MRRLAWVTQDPNCHRKRPYKREAEGDLTTEKGRGDVTVEAEIGDVLLRWREGHKAKNMGDTRSRKKGKKMDSSFKASTRRAVLPTSGIQPTKGDFELLASRTVREDICVFKPP